MTIAAGPVAPYPAQRISADGHPGIHYESFRDYVQALQAIGEVQQIDEPIHWNLEMGAIIRRSTEMKAAAPLFNHVIGADAGLRAMGAPAATSRQPGLYLARLAMMMGRDPRATALELVEAYVEAKSQPVLSPVSVPPDSAPCKRNAMLGDDIDLMRLPVPYIHDGDGGRYIQTAGINIVRSPDRTWTNWSVNRAMLVDKNHLTGLVIPEQHIGMVHGMWKQQGKPTPWALALGVPPAAMIAAGAPMPAYVSEHDFASQLTGAAMQMVACETVDLEVPASAEIVLEGLISDSEMAMEGPLGEYGGYTIGEPKPWPLFTVTAVTYRDRAILPVIAPGRPVEDVHTIWGLGISGETLHLCREAGLPVTACWTPLESATHWMVVTVPDSWHDQTGLPVDEFLHRLGQTIFASHPGWQFPKILVIGDDIDPSDLGQVVWAFATRCHPGSGEILFSMTKLGEWVAYLDSSEKYTGRGGQALYNCLMRSQSFGRPLPEVASFTTSYPRALQDKILANWASYGYPPD
ncbi:MULTISPECIES: UbiD family decarboxylase [unclassified Mycobacterium]|uniref:UbiD family decarboxylase n=1 Tax=unclassified Mycobacterium TaxID=2642494 RepID=UPI0018D3C374|nr:MULTISPECIES: UbiD family decarboxylase [unclassified Mycobacterium]